MKTTINIKIPVDIKYDKEMGGYVAHAPIFGVATQAESLDEAKLAIIDAVDGYLTVVGKLKPS